MADWYPHYKPHMSANYLKNLSSVGDEPVHQALRRYDALISKNPYREEQFTDRLQRNPSLPSIGSYAGVVEGSKASDLPLLIAIASISASAGVGYLFLKKRKEQE